MTKAGRATPYLMKLTPLVIVSALLQSKEVEAQGCKTMIWLPENAGSYLQNHTIQTLTTQSESMCKIMCYLSDLCLSYNFHENTGTCDINDSDEFQHPDDLKAKAGYLYVGIKNGCQSNPCPGNSRCQANFTYKGGFNCLCPSGFTGPSCNNAKDRCHPNPCLHDGYCLEINNDMGFLCNCSTGYRGSHCQDQDTCHPNPCSNSGQCLHTNDGSFVCNCSVGFKGAHCQDKDLCQPNPCQFSDKCKQTGIDSYQCVKNVCDPNPCIHGGRCIEVNDDDYQCACSNEYKGKNCDLIGSRVQPAKSCLEILESGDSHGTGEYWLDLNSEGNSIQAFCDMTTDGGGWTKVKRLYLKDSSVPPPKSFNDYRVLAEYNNQEYGIIPTIEAMANIQQKMGFHQIHFYCHQKSVGRVVSIMTKNNTAGQQVVRYFTTEEKATSFPPACDSFDRLPEDTSILAQNCSLWGKDEKGTWASNRRGMHRLVTRPFAIYGAKKHIFGCFRGHNKTNEHCACDNPLHRLLSANDTWQIAVR